MPQCPALVFDACPLSRVVKESNRSFELSLPWLRERRTVRFLRSHVDDFFSTVRATAVTWKALEFQPNAVWKVRDSWQAAFMVFDSKWTVVMPVLSEPIEKTWNKMWALLGK